MRSWLPLVSVVGFVVGCSSASPGAGAQGKADSGAPAGDGGGDSGGATDSAIGMDAPEGQTPEGGGGESGTTEGGNPLGALAGCLGVAKTLTVSSQMPYVDVPVGSYSGEFILDFGSTFSSIDLSAFPSPGPTTSGCDASELGVSCTVADFAFFGPPSSVVLVTEDYSDVTGSVRQAGLVATDFLSEHVVTLAYAAGTAYASPSSSFCSDAALGAAGFVALTTKGFYENDLSLLEPFSDVDEGASGDSTVPDVPTVPVSLGGATALAQLDTGFDDDVTPFSVNINTAFYMAIAAASPSALVRDSALDGTLSTCIEGVNETVEAYTLASGVAFELVEEGGGVARSYPGATIFVKNTPMSAEDCGGIGTWTVPAAQVGASFYNDMKTIAFDPYSARVWIPKM
jgi:hypothetical protein